MALLQAKLVLRVRELTDQRFLPTIRVLPSLVIKQVSKSKSFLAKESASLLLTPSLDKGLKIRKPRLMKQTNPKHKTDLTQLQSLPLLLLVVTNLETPTK